MEYQRQAEMAPKVSELEANLTAFPEKTVEYFKRANDLMGWTDRILGKGPLIRSQVQRDWMGNVLDISPIDFNSPRRGPLVPDDEWPRVQEYRAAYLAWYGAANQLQGINDGIQALIAKNPALAFVVRHLEVPA